MPAKTTNKRQQLNWEINRRSVSMANERPPSQETQKEAKQLRRKRESLSNEAVEAIARHCVIGDFNRYSDYCRIRQTLTVARSLNCGDQKVITEAEGMGLAKAFIETFNKVADSSQKALGRLAQNDVLYNPQAGGSSFLIPLLGAFYGKLGPGINNSQLFTPNIAHLPGQENGERAKKLSPFTVATERLPLESLSQSSGALPPSANVTAIVKNLPARTQVQHRYAARTVGWQQTSAYVIAGIGCFATFASSYIGFYHNRAVFASTPLFALIAYSGFSSFEVTQDRARYSNHAESISKQYNR